MPTTAIGYLGTLASTVFHFQLYNYNNMNKLTSFASIKAGMKFKVVCSGGGHNYPLNTILTAKRNGRDCSSEMDFACEGHFNNLSIFYIELMAFTLKDMERDLKEMIAKARKEQAELLDKIEFCRAHELDEFDEKFYKSWVALETIDSACSQVEKAKIIASLLN